MPSSVVGSLRVMLGLDSARFTEGMKSAQGGLQRFVGFAKTAGAAVGAAMVAAGGAVAVAMKGVIDEADKMSKLSLQLGVPIDDLSRLRYAAELSDVEIDALSKSIKRLSANMYEAAESANGQAAGAFRALGVSVQDAEGHLRPAANVIEDLADKFAKMKDGPAKTALAMRIFGKSGADLIPLLNAGSAGLQEMYAEAEQLGIVLDTQTGQAAEAFNDNLTRLGKVKDGIITKITAGMLPALEQLSTAMVGAAKNSDAMRIIGAALGWTLNGLVTVAVLVGSAFIGVASDIGAAWDAANRFVRMDFKGGVAAFQAGTSRTQTLLRGAENFVRDLWRPPSGDPPATAALNAGLEDVVVNAGPARRAVERMTDAEREAKRAAEELKREAAALFDATRTPAERYTAQVIRLNQMLQQAAISQDTFNRAMAAAAQEYASSDTKAAAMRDAARAFAEQDARAKEDAHDLAAEHQRDMRDATYDGIRGGVEAAANGDLFGYLAARMREKLFDSIATSLTDLFMSSGKGKGSGGNIFSSIAGLFGGLKLPGFKTGGSFRVGGSGGLDSQTVAFRATPGEMVDIRRPGADVGAGGVQVLQVVPSKWFALEAANAAAPGSVQAGVTAYRAGEAQRQRSARIAPYTRR